MNKIKVIFAGTPVIARDILATLIEMPSVKVVAVISQPDRPIGRKKVLTSTPVKELCLKENILCFQPEKITSIYDEIAKINFDFLITCAYGQFIPTKILRLAKSDTLNIHGSLLPKYRGGAPIQRAIINGETETGASLMRMVQKMDAGPVFVAKKIAIDINDDSGTLFEKIALLGQQLLVENLAKIYQHELVPSNQNESDATFAPIITSKEEEIDWTKSAEQIHNLVRGLVPTPIAHTFLNNQRFKIGKTRLLGENDVFSLTARVHFPGEILVIDAEGIIVQTGTGFLKILEIQRPGKQMQSAKTYYNNPNLSDIKVGMNFDIIKQD